MAAGGFAITLDGTTPTLTANTTATITAPLAGTGSNGLYKAGAGTLVLQGASTYAGNTYIQSGTLQVRPASGVTSVLPSTTAVTIGNNTTNTLALDLRGAAQTVSGLNSTGTSTNRVTSNTSGPALATRTSPSASGRTARRTSPRRTTPRRRCTGA